MPPILGTPFVKQARNHSQSQPARSVRIGSTAGATNYQHSNISFFVTQGPDATPSSPYQPRSSLDERHSPIGGARCGESSNIQELGFDTTTPGGVGSYWEPQC